MDSDETVKLIEFDESQKNTRAAGGTKAEGSDEEEE